MTRLRDLDEGDLLKSALKATEKENELFLTHLKSTTTTNVDPAASCLYVIQGECALMNDYLDKGIQYVGSDDATTCVVIVIQAEDVLFVSHVDETSCKESLKVPIRKCTNDGKKRARLYLAGGYEGDVAEQVLLNCYQNGNDQIELALCCVGSVNLNKSDGFPFTRALALDVRASRPFPFTFPNRGPEISRRHAFRTLGSGALDPIIDERSGELVLKQFFINLNDYGLQYFTDKVRLAKSNPKAFLETYSTSPLHESEMFVPDMTAKMEFILRNNGTAPKELRYYLVMGAWTAK
jgi:Protein N-terminal asparagine amidohydrolase